MAKMVRCVRCHEVFDAEEGPCSKCGTPYAPPRATAEPYEGLYTDRYAGTDVAPIDPVVVIVPPRRRSSTSYLIWGGIGLIGVALVVALVVGLGMAGSPGKTPAPRGIRGAAPTPTLPPTISATIDQLNDLEFSAHVVVSSRIQLSEAVAPKAQVIVIKYDGLVSGGNQWGTLKLGTTSQDQMLANGQGFYRTAGTNKWVAWDVFPPFHIISPVFGLKTTNDLVMVGQETKNGVLLNHLRSTAWWNPDISRLAFADLSWLRITPDVTTLDLWVLPNGTPVSATFSGTNMAGNTSLIDIKTQYSFSDVGVAHTIGAPGPGWTPSPVPTVASSTSPSASASASASK